MNSASKKIAAVCNNVQNCYKIITHKFGNNEFHVYALNGSGLNITPVITAIGTRHQIGIYGQSHDALGQIAISPNRQKVALALCYSEIFQIYDFNMITGILSNPITLGNYPVAWGIEFSPNSQFVYFTHWTLHNVFQAVISQGDCATTSNSITQIGSIQVVVKIRLDICREHQIIEYLLPSGGILIKQPLVIQIWQVMLLILMRLA